MLPILDAHHHFWHYDPAAYAWIDDAMSAIRRDFLPADLKKQIDAAGVSGVISVQARQSLQETEWLLSLAAQQDFIRGVVGWVPLTEPGVTDTLARLAAENPKLRGIRHVLQSEPDPYYMLREDFNRGVAALKDFDLAYDLLIFERQLPQTIEFVDRHPNQTFVVDHLAKPDVRTGRLSPWREHMRELARRPNVACKLSGLATEAGYRTWTEEQLLPYLEEALSAFGPGRTMFASDWPVCEVAVPYTTWLLIVTSVIASYSEAECTKILGDTAARLYRLPASAISSIPRIQLS